MEPGITTGTSGVPLYRPNQGERLMKRTLTRKQEPLHHYYRGAKVIGSNEFMTGNCSGLWGDCTDLRGVCSGLLGDCTDLRGDCSGLRGDCSGLLGNLDNCGLTDEDRLNEVDLQDLIKDDD